MSFLSYVELEMEFLTGKCLVNDPWWEMFVLGKWTTLEDQGIGLTSI